MRKMSDWNWKISPLTGGYLCEVHMLKVFCSIIIWVLNEVFIMVSFLFVISLHMKVLLQRYQFIKQKRILLETLAILCQLIFVSGTMCRLSNMAIWWCSIHCLANTILSYLYFLSLCVHHHKLSYFILNRTSLLIQKKTILWWVCLSPIDNVKEYMS